MKALKTLIATGATLAVVAPAAHATLDKVLPAKAPKAHAVKVVKVSKASHHAITKAKSTGSAASTGVTYIVVTGPVASQPADQDADCQTDGDNCTPQEACQFWGENCDTYDTSTSSPADDSSMQDQTPAG